MTEHKVVTEITDLEAIILDAFRRMEWRDFLAFLDEVKAKLLEAGARA